MQVEVFVVGFAHVAVLVGFERVLAHEAGLDRFFDFGLEFGHRADADFFLPVFRYPDGQRGPPVARTGEVPVHQVFEPVPETSASGSFGLPTDGLVEADHLFLAGRGPDEPGIQRIVDDGLVGTPAMRVGVFVLAGLERQVLFLELDDDVHVHGHGGLGVVIRFVLRLDETSRKFAHAVHEAALAVHQAERTDAVELANLEVVGPEAGGDVDDSRTVLGGHEIPADYAERIPVGRLEIGHQLFVTHADHFAAFEFGHYLVRYGLVARLVVFHRQTGILFGEVGVQPFLAEDDGNRKPGIGIEGVDFQVVDIRPDTEGGVGRQGPRRGRPSQDVKRVLCLGEEFFRFGVTDDLELGGKDVVLDHAVAARLVQLMGAESGTGCRGKRLDGIAFVQQVFFIKLFEQVPDRFDVLVGEGDVRMFEIDPIAHLAREFVPKVLVFHDLFAASGIVVFYADFLADIFLGDT